VLVWGKEDSSWAWILHEDPGGGTRLITRLRQRYRLSPSGAVTVLLAEFGDFATAGAVNFRTRDVVKEGVVHRNELKAASESLEAARRIIVCWGRKSAARDESRKPAGRQADDGYAFIRSQILGEQQRRPRNAR